MNASPFRKWAGPAAATIFVQGLAGCTGSGSSSNPNSSQLFLTRAVESADHSTVTLPIFQGTSHGGTVWYVITNSSSQADALARGVNFSPKLANAKGTTAVQIVTVNNGVIDFPATVTFGQGRVLTAGTNAPFPPAQATAGSTGQAGYSPLMQMPDGTILNASHIANGSGQADKVVALNTTGSSPTMTYRDHRFLRRPRCTLRLVRSVGGDIRGHRGRYAGDRPGSRSNSERRNEHVLAQDHYSVHQRADRRQQSTATGTGSDHSRRHEPAQHHRRRSSDDQRPRIPRRTARSGT